MKKVKLFRNRANAYEKLEKEINEWLVNNPIELMDMKLTSTGEEQGDFITVAIIYEEK